VDHPLTTAARGGIQDFDISLLKTKKAIVFSSKVVPICLATSPPDRDSCFFAGWGRTVAMPPQEWLFFLYLYYNQLLLARLFLLKSLIGLNYSLLIYFKRAVKVP